MKIINRFASIVFVSLFVVMLGLAGTAHVFAQTPTLQQLMQQQMDLSNQAQAKAIEVQQLNAQIQQLTNQMVALQAQIVPGKNYMALPPEENLPLRVENLKSEIDQLSTNAQMAMIQLTSLNNQLAQTQTMINQLMIQQHKTNLPVLR